MQSRDNDKMLQLRVQCSIYNHDRTVEMYDCDDGATQGWSVPCTSKMMHMTQCNCHDAGPMMHTP